MNIMAIVPSNLVFTAILSFTAWRIYRRARRHIGRQPLQPKRMLARIIIFSVVTLAVTAVGFINSKLLLGYGGGVALGAALAWVGLRLTRFENTPQGLFYTPNTYIGVALTMLLAGRVLYRLTVLNSALEPLSPHQPPAFQSPLTLFLFGLLAGYSILYYAGVLWRSNQSTEKSANKAAVADIPPVEI